MEYKTSFEYFIVYLPQITKDYIELEGGIKLWLDTTFNPAEHRIPKAKVVATPKYYDTPVEVGTTYTFTTTSLRTKSLSWMTTTLQFRQTPMIHWYTPMKRMVRLVCYTTICLLPPKKVMIVDTETLLSKGKEGWVILFR